MIMRPNLSFRILCSLPIKVVVCIFHPKNSMKILSIIHIQLSQIKIHKAFHKQTNIKHDTN